MVSILIGSYDSLLGAALYAAHTLNHGDDKMKHSKFALVALVALMLLAMVGSALADDQPFQKLRLTSECTFEGGESALWRITNNNAFPVDYTWIAYGQGLSGSGTAAPGVSQFEAPAGTLILRAGGKQDTKATNPEICAPPPPETPTTTTNEPVVIPWQPGVVTLHTEGNGALREPFVLNVFFVDADEHPNLHNGLLSAPDETVRSSAYLGELLPGEYTYDTLYYRNGEYLGLASVPLAPYTPEGHILILACGVDAPNVCSFVSYWQIMDSDGNGEMEGIQLTHSVPISDGIWWYTHSPVQPPR